MTYLFLKRKMREYERLEHEILRLREEVRREEAQTSGVPSEDGDKICNTL